MRFLVAIFLLAGTSALAQPPGPVTSPQDDARPSLLGGALIIQKSDTTPENLAPYSCRANSLSDMKRFLGVWQVKWTYRASPGEYVESRGRSVIEEALAGCAVREKFESVKGERKFLSEWTVTQSASGDREGVWFDSEHGGFLHFDGEDKNAAATHAFLWRHPNGRMQVRAIYSAFDDAGFTVERHLSTDSGETWVLTNRLQYQSTALEKE